MTIEQLKYAAEAILFASGEAVDIKDMASALDQDVKTMKNIMSELMDDYENRGVAIIQVDTAYQMCIFLLIFAVNSYVAFILCLN